MKIIHFSDTHLGLWLENTKREEDFYNNFEYVIQKIINIKPDVVIHTWDLFHTAKPSNKAISVVVKNFLRLSQSWIKTIVIAWNHDTPRLSTTTHSFEIFEKIENIIAVYNPWIENIEFSETNFVCLPHIHDEDIFKKELESASNYINPQKNNVFLSHFWIQASEYEEYTDEISWVNIKKDDLENLKKYDYVALWHYHKNFCMWNICYSGSLEHTSFNQKDYKIWFNEIDISKNKTQIKKHYIDSRKMIDLWDINCEWINKTQELIELLEKTINKTDLKDAIVKVVFSNMENTLILEFNRELIRKFFEETLFFEFKKIKKENSQKSQKLEKSNWDIIIDNFDNFYKNYTIENEKIDKKLLQKELNDIIKN